LFNTRDDALRHTSDEKSGKGSRVDWISEKLDWLNASIIRGCTMAAVLFFLVGCGGAADLRRDDAGLRAVVEEWRAAMTSVDMDRVMAVYSEDFSCFEAPDREAMRRWLAGLESQGVLRGIEVFADRAELEWFDDRVRVFPIELVGPEIPPTVFRLTLRPEDNVWRIVDQEW
jgi:hypothetical protein